MLGGSLAVELGPQLVPRSGRGPAGAVFLDALVIRCLLLTAVLQIIGEPTWAFPPALGPPAPAARS